MKYHHYIDYNIKALLTPPQSLTTWFASEDNPDDPITSPVFCLAAADEITHHARMSESGIVDQSSWEVTDTMGVIVGIDFADGAFEIMERSDNFVGYSIDGDLTSTSERRQEAIKQGQAMAKRKAGREGKTC